MAKKKATKKTVQNDSPPIEVASPEPVKAAVQDRPTTAKEPVKPTSAEIGVKVGPVVVLNMSNQAVAPGMEDTKIGGVNASRYTGTINLSVAQRIGLHRLRVGLNAAGELVAMPRMKGRKEVTTDSDAIRWILERVAELD